MSKNRITWIDCWKGIAIVIVVAGHILDLKVAKYIFWFHMPLFFFISGYLYKEKHDYLSFFKKKFFHLILPYISFLLLFSIPNYAKYISDIWQTQQLDSLYQLFLFTLRQLYGGEILTDNFDVFWFVTCLFFTQQLYNFLYTTLGSDKWLINIIMLNTYCLAMIDYWFFKDILFPWNIDVVLMALPFYWFGHMTSENSTIFNYKKLVPIAVITLVIVALIDNFYLLELTFDMKRKSYGIPILNLIIAMAGIIIVQQMAEAASQINFFDGFTRSIGAASMTIMYLHQPIQISFKEVSFLNEGIIRLIAGLFIPYIAHRIIMNFSITRKLFLGEFRNRSKTLSKTLSKV